ncbi:MAG TPA: inositol monophosphatase family protein [Terriglobales bacterium]|nr:inositol monophosphatase family protein [Terriglobales bacterium]
MTANTPQFEFVPAISEIAREAGALLMGYFHRRVKIEYKGDVDLVTEADRQSEALILSRIREEWPSHDVMGEEGSRIQTGSDYLWYIDPLDGTTNFAHGFPVFCVSIALEHKGIRVAGAVFDPTRDELFAAELGRGAYLNHSRITVSKIDNLAECLVATGFPSHKRHKNPNIFFYHQITLRTHGVRRAGSAALDLCSVAAGRVDGFWEFNLNPWDTAAGVLIAEEAGGRVSRFDGSSFQIDSRETLASNGLVHNALLAEFEAIFQGRGLQELPSPLEYAKGRAKL